LRRLRRRTKRAISNDSSRALALALSRTELQELGDRMAERKKELGA